MVPGRAGVSARRFLLHPSLPGSQHNAGSRVRGRSDPLEPNHGVCGPDRAGVRRCNGFHLDYPHDGRFLYRLVQEASEEEADYLEVSFFRARWRATASRTCRRRRSLEHRRQKGDRGGRSPSIWRGQVWQLRIARLMEIPRGNHGHRFPEQVVRAIRGGFHSPHVA